LKARYFFPGLAAVVGLGFYLASIQPEHSSELIPGHGEFEQTTDIYMDPEEVDPADAWMYDFVEPTSEIRSNQIYSFQCELMTKRPEAFTTACADFGRAVWDLKWTRWDAFGAEATGVYRENDCDPSCAEGSFTTRDVTVSMMDLTQKGEFYFFNTARIRYADVEYPVDEYEFVWDVADFYREDPNMRSPLPGFIFETKS
jgi:hypothetical protein